MTGQGPQLAGVLAAMQLMDSALPTGAFSHSLGFETYLDRGVITSAEDFRDWLEMFTRQQLTFTEAMAVRLVYRAESFGQIADLDDLVTCQALPSQVRAAGITMGRRLMDIAAEAYPGRWLAEYRRGVDERQVYGHQSIVWAIVARELGIAEEEAVAQHLYATVISLTQNAVRAVPIGQNAGQRIIRQAQGWVTRAVRESAELGPEDLGAVTPGLEIAQMQHQTQRARMFMS